MRAYVLIREQPWYRRDAFICGLRAAGHTVETRQPVRLDRDTLIVIWNRYSGNHELATQVERAGGTVLVAENGYLGAGGTTPKFDVHPGGPKPHHYYAIARGFHNDDTRSLSGATPRFEKLGVVLKPWRNVGRYILICPNRSFGVPGRIMPPDWATFAAKRWRKQTGFAVKIREHPGNDKPKYTLEEDLRDALACIVWSSSCGVHALAEGVPTVSEGPYWILRNASAKNILDLATLPDRQPHFERMSWAQWNITEIANGEPFRHLLPATG